MRAKILLLAVLSLFFITFPGRVKAQVYGNEWIKNGQYYVKIKIGKTGAYRINYTALVQASQDLNFNIGSQDAKKMQMFRNGKEIPIYVAGEADGRFNTSDFIEFYAQLNDGKLDNEIYEQGSFQPHDKYSLITDTSIYFLVFPPSTASVTPLRLKNYSNTSFSSYTPQPYFISEQFKFFTEQYFYGVPFQINSGSSTSEFQYSEYTEGEGYCSNRFGFGQGSVGNIRTEQVESKFYNSSGPAPTVDYQFYGVTDFAPVYTDHRMQVSVSPNNISMTQILDTSFAGYAVVKSSAVLNPSAIGTTGTFFKFETVSVPGVTANGHALSYIRLRYPRNFDLDGSTVRKFDIDASGSATPVRIDWANYGNGTQKNPIVYDLSRGYRVRAQYSAGACRFIMPGGGTPECYINDSTDITLVQDWQVEGVEMFDPSPTVNNTQFLIITNKKLLGAATDDYANYRKASYKTNLVTVQQLYNTFTYGNVHPLAIRRYCNYLITNSAIDSLRHVLLLGRGYQTDYVRASTNNYNNNLVPSVGVPASDLMLVSGLNGTNWEPAVSIGRVSVDKEDDIVTYLAKLKDYEQSPLGTWRKEVMHLGGGLDGQQSKIIRGRLDLLQNFPQAAPFGGTVKSYYKAATGINEPFVRQKVEDEIEHGKSLITFLGHGSSTVVDLDIGVPGEWKNTRKYPVFYFNGCSVGNPAIGLNNKGELFYGEEIIRTPNGGGIAFLGQTSTSELYTVSSQMRDMYTVAFGSHFGASLGDIVKQTIRRNEDLSSLLSKLHCRQLLLQGDPALRLYSPELPDYHVQDGFVYLAPPNLTALSDSFAVAIIIENRGRYTPDSTIDIHLKRTYPNNYVTQDYYFTVPSVAFRDTFYYYIKSKDLLTTGENTFEIHINHNNRIQELDYTNNKVNYLGFIPGNGVNLVYPRRYDIVSHLNNDTIQMVAQALNMFEKNMQYDFEIDTSHKFNSPWVKRITGLNAGHIASWKVRLMNVKDSTVYYWRARLRTSSTSGGTFEERSFIYIFDNAPGWSQSHFPQFYPSTRLSSIDLDTVKRRFEFSPNSRKIWVDTDIQNASNKGVKVGGGFSSQDLNYGVCENGLVLMIFDKNDLQLRPWPGFTPHCYWGSAWTTFGYPQNYQVYYTFQMADSSNRVEFRNLITALDPGTHVAMFSRGQMMPSKWDPATKTMFSLLGGVEINKLNSEITDSTAFVMVGTKGNALGTAFENYSTLTRDPGGQWINGYAAVEAEIIGKSAEGSIISERIGPTDKWETLFFNYKPDETPTDDRFNVDVYGVTKNGRDTLLLEGLVNQPYNLNAINASVYPYIYLKGNMKDSALRTAPQLKNWRVTSNELPEGTLDPTINYAFYNDTLQEGEQFRYKLAFRNISKYTFDPLLYNVKVYNVDTRAVWFDSYRRTKDSLRPAEFFYVDTTFSTKGMKGRYAIFISVNPGLDQPEMLLLNNVATQYFEIVTDKINPLLDVTFDNRHIMDGDIVSPSPVILIVSKDENKYLLQKDTAGIDVFLRYPNSTDFVQVDVKGPLIKFYPATNGDNTARMEFLPKDLPDGVYRLRVQSRDASGNVAGANFYEISFTVISESSTTNFYPYPNPFTTSMRFVFTLTGKEVPDYINVKIMTITGKVVKEISKADLGELRIGNNISEIAWDGNDQFGDRLANGVYLYTVTMKRNGEDIGQLESGNIPDNLSADKANNKYFKHQTGKIYLLR